MTGNKRKVKEEIENGRKPTKTPKVKEEESEKKKIKKTNALTLSDIQDRLHSLISKIPAADENEIRAQDLDSQISWAKKVQAILEEFNLLLSCVSPATYKWSSERSGAADHNLAVLSAELSNAQEQLSSVVSNKISNVLCPVVDLVIAESKTETKTVDGIELKTQTNTFTREVVDDNFQKLCGNALHRNAEMITCVILANLTKAHKVISDYLKDLNKDGNKTSFGSSMAY